jgi:hypothetical protein
MKTINVVASAILMSTAFGVGAVTNPPSAPDVYAAKGATPAPNLFLSEKAAFAVMEGALQEAEAIIYQGGCAAASGNKTRVWDVSTNVDDTATGSIDVSSNGVAQFSLAVKGGELAGPPKGSKFDVSGDLNNVLNGSKLPKYSSTAYYSATGQMMTQAALFEARNVNNNYDKLSGTVIKDFYKVGGKDSNPVIYDWGLQSVSKNNIPQDKWWQRSRATRSDNDYGRTTFIKDRLFSAKNGGTCRIVIDTTGTNDADGFFQDGTLTISK